MRKRNWIAVVAMIVASLGLMRSVSAVPIPDVTNAGDPIIAIDFDGGSGYPGGETPPNAINNTLAKYLNTGGVNSGFIVTPSNNPIGTAVGAIRLTTANDVPDRDPASYVIYGTNDPITSLDNSTGNSETWTQIAAGSLSLPAARNTAGFNVPFANTQHFNSFRVVFPTLKNNAVGLMQIAEVQLVGLDIAPPPVIADITVPGDFIIPIDLDGVSSSPAAEQAPNAIDNTLAKYLNTGGLNSGFIVTPTNNPAAYFVDSLTITTANDAPDRDPASFMLFGTNDPITSLAHSNGSAESWSLIASGALALPAARNTVGPTVTFENYTHYTSYRLVFPTLKNGGQGLMQIGEVQLGANAIPEPATLGALLLGACSLVVRRRRRSA